MIAEWTVAMIFTFSPIRMPRIIHFDSLPEACLDKMDGAYILETREAPRHGLNSEMLVFVVGDQPEIRITKLKCSGEIKVEKEPAK